MSLPEDLELLPNGTSGTLLIKSADEFIDSSLNITHANFAIGLEDDCTPKKSFDYHFTNSSEKFSIFGKLIENELSEIYWFSPNKCLIINGEVTAKVRANITINAPCVVIKDACFINFDQIKFFNKNIKDLAPNGPIYEDLKRISLIIDSVGEKCIGGNITISSGLIHILGSNELNALTINDSEIYHHGKLGLLEGGHILSIKNFYIAPNSQIITSKLLYIYAQELNYHGNFLVDKLLIRAEIARLLNETGIAANIFDIESTSFENQGNIAANDISIKTDQEWQNNHEIVANQSLLLSSNGVITNKGSIYSYGLSIHAFSFINDNFTQVSNQTFINATSDVVNNGEFNSKSLSLFTQHFTNNKIIRLDEGNFIQVYYEFTNNDGLISNSLTVISQQFFNNNFIQVENDCHIKIWSNFLNKANAQFIVGTINITNHDNEQVQSIINQGKIKITSGPSTFKAKFMHVESTGFATYVKEVENQQIPGNRKYSMFCNAWRHELYNNPIIASIDSTSDINFQIGKFEITSGKIYVQGYIKFNSEEKAIINNNPLYHWAVCEYKTKVGDDFGGVSGSSHRFVQKYGGIMKHDSLGGHNVDCGTIFNNCDYYVRIGRYSNSNSVYKTHNSIIHAVQNITGDVHNLELFTTGHESPQIDFQENNNFGNALVPYQLNTALLSNALKANENFAALFYMLSNTVTEHNNAAILQNAYFSVLITSHINTGIYSFQNPTSFLPSGDGLFFLNSHKYLTEQAFDLNQLIFEYQKLDLSSDDPSIMIGDSHFIDDLVQDQIFRSIGVITGIDNTRLAEQLIKADIEALHKFKDKYGKLGEPLTRQQVDNLDSPVIHFVYITHENTGHKVLYPVLYWNHQAINSFLWGSGLSSEGDINLKVSGNAILDSSAHIIGKNIKLVAKDSVINFGTIKSSNTTEISAKQVYIEGSILTGKDLAIRALEGAITGTIIAEGDLDLQTLNNLVMLTLVETHKYICSVRSDIKKTAEIFAKGKIILNSLNENIFIAGARVMGNLVYIRVGKEFHAIPVEIYNSVTKYSKKFYYHHRSLTLQKSLIATHEGAPQYSDINAIDNELSGHLINTQTVTQTDGHIVVSAKKGINIKASDFIARNDISFVVEEGKVIITAANEEQFTETRTIKKKCTGSKKTNYNSWLSSNVISPIIKSGKNLFSSSHADQYWIGAEIYCQSTKLIAGTPEHVAHITMLPASQISEITVYSKTSSFSIDFTGKGISFYEHNNKGKMRRNVTPIPTIIHFQKEFWAYSNGKFIYIDPTFITESSETNGKKKITVNAQEISLELAPHITTEYNYFSSTTSGIGFSSTKGEFAIKAFIKEETGSSLLQSTTFKPYPFPPGTDVEMTAEKISQAGILYHSEKLYLNSKVAIYGVVYNTVTHEKYERVIEAGVKFGVKSNFGRIADLSTTISKENYNTPESIINGAFESWELYHNVLTLLSSSANYGISSGGWFYLEGSQTKSNSEIKQAVPVIMNVKEVNFNHENIELVATQVNAYRMYLQTKYLKATSGENTYKADSKTRSMSIEIPISGAVNPNLGIALGNNEIFTLEHLNVNIRVSDKCILKVSAKATLNGFSLLAHELDAEFDELILASVQNVIEMQGKGFNLGIGLTSATLDNIGANLQKRSRHVVDELSYIVGTETARVIVGNALRLNGAMIANAERNTDGSFTDRGHLTLTVGELFVQHINDYDNGKTLGASVSLMKQTEIHTANGEKLNSFTLGATVGYHDKVGSTYATIGKGDVEVKGDPSVLDQANRDVVKAQNAVTGEELKPINIYYRNLDTKALKEGIPDSVKGWFAGVTERIKSVLFPTSPAVKPEPEIEEELPEEVVKEKKEKQATKKPKQVKLKSINKAEDEEKYDSTKIASYEVGKANEVFNQELQKFVTKLNKENPDILKANNKDGNKALLYAAKVADKVVKFAEDFQKKYPISAKALGLTGQTAINALLLSPAGIGRTLIIKAVGATAAQELMGEAIALALGKEIGKLIKQGEDATVIGIRLINPEISIEEAKSLYKVGLTVGIDGIDVIKASKLTGKLANKIDKVDVDIHKAPDIIEASDIVKKPNKYLKYKIEGNEPWAQDYNKWLETVDTSKLEKHHVFSDKNNKILEHDIFKEGILDPKVLKDKNNIMPLPKEKGLHPTASVHSGRHDGKVIKDLAQQLTDLKADVDSKFITKSEATSKFQELIKQEKAKLYWGEIKLNKKGE